MAGSFSRGGDAMRRWILALPLLLAGCVVYAEQRAHTIPARNPLTVDRIVDLSKSGSADATIKGELAEKGLAAKLTSDDIVRMEQDGVSEAVSPASLGTP